MEKLLVSKRIFPEEIRNESKEMIQLLTIEKDCISREGAEPEGRIENEVKLVTVIKSR